MEILSALLYDLNSDFFLDLSEPSGKVYFYVKGLLFIVKLNIIKSIFIFYMNY
jgi:hypothetical protein